MITLDIVQTPRLRVPAGLARHLIRVTPDIAPHLPKALRFPAEATLLLTSNAAIRRLNHDFRGKDKATNVLSFPQLTLEEILTIGTPTAPVALGDIALAFPYVLDEARKKGISIRAHATHLLIHGILHLFGYDHLLDTDAVCMEGLETKIMTALGFPDPYPATPEKEPHQGRAKGTPKRRAATRPSR